MTYYPLFPSSSLSHLRLPERLKERIGLLRLLQSDFGVDDEERHAFDSKAPSQFVSLADRLHFVIAIQHGLSLAPVQSGLGHLVNERLVVADVPTCVKPTTAKLCRPKASVPY